MRYEKCGSTIKFSRLSIHGYKRTDRQLSKAKYKYNCKYLFHILLFLIPIAIALHPNVVLLKFAP